jgi:peroxiredoxin
MNEHPIRPGHAIDDFALTDDRGSTWRLSDHRGRPTLLIFHRHLM